MQLSKSKVFLLCCLSFIVGIGLASFLSADLDHYKLYLFAIAILFSVITVTFWQSGTIRLVFLIGLFLFFGLWRFFVNQPIDSPDKIWHYLNQKIKYTGIVSAPPDVRVANQKITVETRSVEMRAVASLHNEISGKVLITTGLFPTYNYGDELAIECKLLKPEEINGFAYDKYLARYDIYALCFDPKIELLKIGQGKRLYAFLYVLKSKLTGVINRGLNEPVSGLANAIMFGDKRGLPQELLDIFSQTGTIHIMAISGMNITIIAALALQLMLGIGLNRRQAFYLATALLVLFIILVGAPASAVRAGIMGFLMLVAIHLGRLSKAINATILAGAVMLLTNPKLLRFDIGFQLSFLAILGLIYVYPVLNERIAGLTRLKFKAVREVLAMTMAAQIFTLPITAYNFSMMSVIAPLPNLLILWSIPILTALIFIAIALSFILPALSVIFFTPAWLIISYINIICIWSAKLPLAYLKIDYLSPFWPANYYLFFAIIIFVINRNKKQTGKGL